MRVMMRGSPRMPRGGGMAPPFRAKRFMLRSPFDLAVCEDVFQRVRPQTDDTQTQQVLMKRNADISPSSVEQAAILGLLNMVADVLDTLIVAPQNFDACHLEEHRQVGSFKKGTMRTGHNVADLVAILKTLPTRQAVEALAHRTLGELRQRDQSAVFSLTILDDGRGFDLISEAGANGTCGAEATAGAGAKANATVRVLVTTIHQNLRKLDPSLHISIKHLKAHLAAIRHSRWFEENAHHSSIKILIRLLRDLRDNFPGLQALNPWLIDLLAHYAVMNTPDHQPLPIPVAFRRSIQLLAAGIFLPGSAGILDPCESGSVRSHLLMRLDEQDRVCLTAQTLLRVLAQAGVRQLLGPPTCSPGAVSELSVYDGVVVSPQQPVHDTCSSADTGQARPPQAPPSAGDTQNAARDESDMDLNAN